MTHDAHQVTGHNPGMNGILIAFEGIDGAGKTTQARLLAQALERVNETIILAKEPTDGPFGRRLRESASTGRLSAAEELDAFIADRREHTDNRIRPTLEAGHTLILDRYFYSTLAYQGIRLDGYGGIESRVREGVIVPDVVYWLDLPVPAAMERITHRDGAANHFERAEDLQRIGELFRQLANDDPIMVRIDATPPVERIHQAILAHFIHGPWKAKRCAKTYGCEDAMYCAPRMAETCQWANLVKASGLP
jgi:dTMP kinase